MSDRNMQSVLANLLADPAVIAAGTDVSSHKSKQISGLLMCLELPAHPAPGLLKTCGQVLPGWRAATARVISQSIHHFCFTFA